MIAVIDYGMGNLRSVEKALQRSGGDARIVTTAAEIARADKIVLPGVAAFGEAMEHILEHKLDDAIRDTVAAGTPYLGFCLGMQMLFEVSYEYGEHRGLGILPGKVVRFDFDSLPDRTGLRCPHIGWNQVHKTLDDCNGLAATDEGTFFYFDHSYHVVPDDASIIAATTDYGPDFVSAIQKDNIFATQFHPEKSQAAGLTVLKQFINA